MLTPKEYQVLVEQAPIMIWRAAPDKLCNYFNARWLEFTGRALDHEVGNGWAEGVHPDDYERCLRIYVANFDERRIFEMTYRLRRYDGAYRWIFDRGVPYYESDGSFGGYIGSCVDVTEKVEAEEALNAARNAQIARLQALLPVCAWCRKIRTDDGYWQALEEYASSQNLGHVTHSICRECAERVERELQPLQEAARVSVPAD